MSSLKQCTMRAKNISLHQAQLRRKRRERRNHKLFTNHCQRKSKKFQPSNYNKKLLRQRNNLQLKLKMPSKTHGKLQLPARTSTPWHRSCSLMNQLRRPRLTGQAGATKKIGRVSCRERVCQYV